MLLKQWTIKLLEKACKLTHPISNKHTLTKWSAKLDIIWNTQIWDNNPQAETEKWDEIQWLENLWNQK